MHILGKQKEPIRMERVTPPNDKVKVTADGTKIFGYSESGLGTSIHIVKEADQIANKEGYEITVDAGAIWKSLIYTKDLWITHEHPDHVQDLVKLISYRTLLRKTQEMPRMCIYAQPNIALWLTSTYEAMILTKAHVEDIGVVDYTHKPEHQIERYKIPFYGRFLVPFRTDHTVPTFGFKLIETDGTPILAYIPDTTSAVFEKEPDVLEFPTIIMEATLSEDIKDMYKAAKHMSFEEAFYYADKSKASDVILTHTSPISDAVEMGSLIKKRSNVDGPKIHLLF